MHIVNLKLTFCAKFRSALSHTNRRILRCRDRIICKSANTALLHNTVVLGVHNFTLRRRILPICIVIFMPSLSWFPTSRMFVIFVSISFPNTICRISFQVLPRLFCQQLSSHTCFILAHLYACCSIWQI